MCSGLTAVQIMISYVTYLKFQNPDSALYDVIYAYILIKLFFYHKLPNYYEFLLFIFVVLHQSRLHIVKF